ncbi:MAG: helix-turn-helix transcriptional regulator [Candidatus Sericytochromatia bacterium]
MSAFGKELALIRKKNNYTQYKLAKEIELSKSYILRLENGERPPNLGIIEKITKFFSLNKYETIKLLHLGNLDINIEDTNEDFKLCYKLSLELKNKYLFSKAQDLIKIALNIFKNDIKLTILSANLKTLQKKYNEAIELNKELIIITEGLKDKERKTLGISKAEIIHNLGYVYFERALDNIELRVLEVVKSWEEKKKSNEVEILTQKILDDIDIAIEKLEIAYNIEKNNLTIVDQLARIYFNKAELSYNEERIELFNKTVILYDLVISKEDKDFEHSKKEEASIFLALALAKLFRVTDALRIVNTIINYRPLYYLGYYVKACIYSINGKNNLEYLSLSYDFLKKALELESSLKEQINLELDFYNLRYNNTFYSKFNDLVGIN